jgi:hypothetical protein
VTGRELDGELRRLLVSRKKTFACRTDALEAAEAFALERLGKHHRFATDPPEIVEVPRYGKLGRPARRGRPKRSVSA